MKNKNFYSITSFFLAKIDLVNLLLLFLFTIGVCHSNNAQINNFYYYHGERIHLIVDKSKINLSVNDKFRKSDLSNSPLKEYTFQKDLSTNIKYTELEFRADLTDSEYIEIINTIKNTTNVRKVDPLYFDKKGESVGINDFLHVKLKCSSDLGLLEKTISKYHVKIQRQNKYMPLWYTLKCTENTLLSSLEVANRLYETKLFESSEPNLFIENAIDACPNDNWGVEAINACNTYCTTGNGVSVAIFDTGVDLEHAYLVDNIVSPSYNAANDTSPSIVTNDHGTNVARFVVDVATECSLLSISHNFSIPTFPAQLNDRSEELADGFNWAVDNGADIINCSWHWPESQIVEDAIANALTNGRGGLGSIVVFASGNTFGPVNFPANSLPDILVVGATDDMEFRPDFSSFGNTLDIVAPGKDVPMLLYNPVFNPEGLDFGTSYAAPHVSGVAALILSINSNLTLQEVNNIIEQTAHKSSNYSFTNNPNRPNGTWNEELGYGQIDAQAAVISALEALEYESNCFCSDVPTNDYLVGQSETLTLDKIHGTLTVQNGATLTINSVVEFTPISKLIIQNGGRLIVESGGVLTKCSDEGADNWQGIQLGSDIDNSGPGSIGTGPAIIELKSSTTGVDGGVIEHANIGINNRITVSNNSGPFISSQESTGGEIVMTGNSTIQNCDIGIYFGMRGLSTSFNSTPESSVFNTAIFKNNEIGIKLQRNHGLPLNNNTFDENVTSILLVNSSSTINDNQFRYDLGIWIEATYPSFYGTDIFNNEFYSTHGVLLSGIANGNEINIHNNRFFDNAWGITGIGLADFSIANNDFFDTPYPSTFNNTGDNQLNLVEENAFYSSFTASQVTQTNDVEYLNNCFNNSSYTDLHVTGKMHITQGNVQNASGNCFSNENNLVQPRIYTEWYTDFFTYFTKDGYQNPQSCKYPEPDVNINNFEVMASEVELAANCGSGINLFGSIPPNYRDCIIPIGPLQDKKDMRDFIEEEIHKIENDLINSSGSVATGYFKTWLLAKYRRCLDRVIKVITGDIIKTNDPDTAVHFLQEQSDPRYLIMAYGVLVDMQNYDEAQTLLNTIPTNNSEIASFVQIQNVYLTYLVNPIEFILDDFDKDYIKLIGESSGTLSGFARAIYFDLLGIRLQSVYGDQTIDASTRNSDPSEGEALNRIKLYPNPNSSEIINLVVSQADFEKSEKRTYVIHDITGQKVLNGTLDNSSIAIDISSLDKSLYFIEVSISDFKRINKFIKI